MSNDIKLKIDEKYERARKLIMRDDGMRDNIKYILQKHMDTLDGIWHLQEGDSLIKSQGKKEALIELMLTFSPQVYGEKKKEDLDG